MTLDELCTRRVAVWGLGDEGLAMARLLHGRGVEPCFADDRPEAAAVRLEERLGELRPVLRPDRVPWSDIDVVVRAPGVSRYRAELDAARAAGATVTTAMALWLEDFADAPVVAVTGTKGKSTTAALTAALLGRDGLDVALIGNIGVPVVERYGLPPADAYVVEISSFQAADVTTTPGVVVLTSLAPDHLDWHRSEEAYYRDKLRLLDAGPPGELAVNAGSQEALSRTAGHPRRTLFGPSGRVAVDGSGVVTLDGMTLVGRVPVADSRASTTSGTCAVRSPGPPFSAVTHRRGRRSAGWWRSSRACHRAAGRWASATASRSSMMPWPPIPSPRRPPSGPSPTAT